MSKLNILLAEKVMQWTMDAPPGIPAGYRPAILFDRNDGRGWQTLDEMGWNPEKHLDDALVCLERACPDGFDIERMPHHPDERLRCVVTANCAQARGLNPSVAIAMCLCSLRAMGVPESEIQEAMK